MTGPGIYTLNTCALKILPPVRMTEIDPAWSTCRYIDGGIIQDPPCALIAGSDLMMVNPSERSSMDRSASSSMVARPPTVPDAPKLTRRPHVPQPVLVPPRSTRPTAPLMTGAVASEKQPSSSRRSFVMNDAQLDQLNSVPQYLPALRHRPQAMSSQLSPLFSPKAILL